LKIKNFITILSADVITAVVLLLPLLLLTHCSTDCPDSRGSCFPAKHQVMLNRVNLRRSFDMLNFIVGEFLLGVKYLSGLSPLVNTLTVNY
jgi:hypothetical protein